MPRLGKFFRRSFADQALLLEALANLVVAKILIHGIPFRWLAPRLGTPMASTPMAASEEDQAVARRIGWAVEAVARHSPIRFVCFPQAVAAHWMLRRRGLSSTLYLGVRLKPEKKEMLMAHAWVRFGNRILTGFDQSRTHKTLASFAKIGN
jgi:hypothetical protein